MLQDIGVQIDTRVSERVPVKKPINRASEIDAYYKWSQQPDIEKTDAGLKNLVDLFRELEIIKRCFKPSVFT